MPYSYLEHTKPKELRKILGSQMKLNQNLTPPGQKHLSSMQAKLHYMKIVNEQKAFGSRVFMVTLLVRLVVSLRMKQFLMIYFIPYVKSVDSFKIFDSFSLVGQDGIRLNSIMLFFSFVFVGQDDRRHDIGGSKVWDCPNNQY